MKMIRSFKGKVCVVSGGTKGIGLETAKIFAQKGAATIICARNISDFQENGIEAYKVDVSSSEECLAFFNKIMDKYGHIDVLVCNAGITKDSMTYKMTDEMFDQVLSINLKGVFNLVRLIGPQMEKQGFGSIVNVSSVVGRFGNIGQANYAASKSGIVGMSLSWAKEFARKGANIRVNVVSPGYIMTDMLKTVPNELLVRFSEQTMLKRLGEPIEVANVITFLSSDSASYITGTVVNVDGGMRL